MKTRNRPTSKDRIVSRARKYLETMEYKCAYPNCPSPARDVHHIVPLSNGGLDEVKNMVALCRYHHQAKGLHGRWEETEILMATLKHIAELERFGRILDTNSPSSQIVEESVKF